MSKLKELIDRLCPDGVGYKQLDEIVDFRRGQTITEKDSVPGDIPVIAGGQKPAYYHNQHNRLGQTIAIAGSGAYAGFVSWWEQPIFLSDAFSLHPKDNSLFLKYLYYYLVNIQKKIHHTKKGSGVPHVHPSSIAKFTIPVPPIEVQEEIVRILDLFTAYAAELQAELQARKEEYEYYRNLLLSFNPSACGLGTDGQQGISELPQWMARLLESRRNRTNNVTTPPTASYTIEWKTMGEIGTFYGGLTGKTKSDFSNGNARFISYKNVYSNIAINQNADEYVVIGPNENQNTLELGDAIFTGSSETPDECGISSVVTVAPKEKLYLNSFCFGFRLNDTSIYNPDFLKHLLRSKHIRTQIAKTANGVTRYNVSKALFANIILPIPSLEAQDMIAAFLDKYEALVNDLTSGLPAEIEAQRLNYEYWRDRLLSFPQKSA